MKRKKASVASTYKTVSVLVDCTYILATNMQAIKNFGSENYITSY